MKNPMALKKRLDALEQRKSREICWAYFSVRKGHEDEDFKKQKAELMQYWGDCPPQTQYCVATFDALDETYDSFMLQRRKGKTFKEWWSLSTLRGIP